MARIKLVPDNGNNRTCTACREVKLIDRDFHKNPTDSTGYRAVCKSCRNYDNSQIQYEKMLLAGDKFIKECPECEGYFRSKKGTYDNCSRCRNRRENENDDVGFNW